MAWLAVDKDGGEWIYDVCPERGNDVWLPSKKNKRCVIFPKNSIKKLINRELTWEDEPVKI